MVLDNVPQAGKVGLACFVAGTCFFLTGFSVPYWVVFSIPRHDVRIGLWEYCASSICVKTTSSAPFGINSFTEKSWYRGTQALACLALIALMVDFIIRILFFYGKQKQFLLISVILDCATAILAVLAAVVFGSEIESLNDSIFRLHFGFAFDIIGGIFFAVSAACFLVEYLRRR